MMANLEATGGGEGVKWLKNEPYVQFNYYYLDMTTLMDIGI